MPFLRTTAFLIGALEPAPVLFLPLPRGVANGGGLLDRAASQSKGTEEEIEGVDAGDRYIPTYGLLRGVKGGGPVTEDLEGVSGLLGELVVDAALFS